MLILFSHEINNTKEGIWNKTIQLSKLIALGYRVPDFIAIPTGVIASITEKKIHIETLATAIRKIFPQTSYAVRSSCLSEDGASNSMAGQFHTELSVMPKNLEEAIIQVIEQAQQTGIHESQISIIVQKYIHADYSGVCFTRNPVAGSEMAFEYHKGIGEDLVGGKSYQKKSPTTKERNEKSADSTYNHSAILKQASDIHKISNGVSKMAPSIFSKLDPSRR